jgi:hypothetical protein
MAFFLARIFFAPCITGVLVLDLIWLGVYASEAIESKKSPSLAQKRSMEYIPMTQLGNLLPCRLGYLKTIQNHYRAVRYVEGSPCNSYFTRVFPPKNPLTRYSK